MAIETRGAAGPVFGRLVARTDRSVVVRHRLDPATAPWLAHHSIGREVSTRDPHLYGLSVVPLAMSLELVAEAARTVAPGLVVTRLLNVRANRWLAFDNEEQTFDVHAELESETDGVASVRVQCIEAGLEPPAVAATVELARIYPSAEPPSLAGAIRPSELDPARYYEDALYHDSTWRVLAARAHIEERRATTVVDLAPFASFSGHEIEILAVHPVLLDAVGQLLGLWSAQILSEGAFHFPVGADEVVVNRPPPAGHQRVRIALEVTAIEPTLLVAEAELTVGDHLYARISRFRSRRFYVPHDLVGLALPTALGNVCHPVPLEGLGLGQTRSTAVTLDVGGLGDEAFVSRVWAARIMSRAERQSQRSLHDQSAIPLRQLAAAHTAKEATRRLLADRLSIDVLPADIDIASVGDHHRAIAASSMATAEGNASISEAHVWVAQAGDRTTALASLDDDLGNAQAALDRMVVTAPAGVATRPDADQVLQLLGETIERLSGDWEIDHPITPDTRLVGDLAMKSIDLVVIASAMVNAYGLIAFDELYAEMASIPANERDLTVARLVEFVLARAPRGELAANAQG